MKKFAFAITAVIILLAGCQSDILHVEEMTKEEASETNLKRGRNTSTLRCVNVRDQQTFNLGFVTIDFKELSSLFYELNAEFGSYLENMVEDDKVSGPGADFKNIFEDYFDNMQVASIVVHEYQRGDGAIFGRLFHLFKSQKGSFLTLDEVVQTPYNRQMVSRINNKLEIVAGTGIFKDVSGRIINNGIIQIVFEVNDEGDSVPVPLLHANLHGRICY